jgi:hypothetical protein
MAMEISKTQFVMLTDIEKIIYPENQPGVAGIWETVTSNNLITIPSLINNNFRSIFCKAAFYKIIFLSNLLFLLGIFKTQAQQNENYALYANIIYRVTNYFNWPDGKKSGYFVIGIVGDSPLYDEIKSFTANKTVGNQKIVIKTFSSSASSYDCQILFISENESRSLKKIVKVTVGTPTLLISEFSGLANKGSCINFIIVDEHLKLEINKNNIEQRNLDVASEFLVLGTIVK